MIINVYAMYDRKVQYFHPPFLSANDEAAKRQGMLLFEKNPSLRDFCEDYDLMRIGTFDDATGELENLNTSLVVDGEAIVEKLNIVIGRRKE
jgi:hypothetical protein